MRSDNKGELVLGSPRNITVNTLNGNQFFTLDYESNDPMAKTFFIESYNFDTKDKDKANKKGNQFIIKNPVKSAQYVRSSQAKSYQPFSKSKKADQIMNQKRKYHQIIKLASTTREKGSIAFPKPTIDQQKNKTSEKKYRSYVMESIEIQQDITPRKQIKPLNSFQQNYKNRKKLADRALRKSPRNITPIQEPQKEESKERFLSPMNRRFLLTHLRNRSIEGNKIRFEFQEKLKKRYN